ncbi:PspC domain-containing protein [Oceanihabitans sediminis]|uniref:PspC domain-containing protein n=1 Tax=Oceanihabitans sediminis TaxID=1812012 RepID=UPI000930281A|nr:PspC domain-containing protein [Oceanihabitans sediminis]MDX1277400.1 PspC domain-containing protein [Oceanihabitans sediminis]
MNKTVNINLAGIFFHIDEDAYLKLQRYLDAIKRSFTDSQGRAEIISDIEARIAELFNERVKHDKQVIGIKEVDEIITIMGQPEDYIVDEEIFEDDPINQTGKKSARKLFRDTDNSYVGGVSAGLGHYFGIDAIWIRLIWFLLIFGAGTGALLYIILWILVPEAVTTSDKLMMRGEPVNISNIEKKIKDGISTVSDTVQDVAKNVSDSVSDATKNVDFKKKGNSLKSSSKSFFDTIGDILGFFLKIVAKFIGIILVFIGSITVLSLAIGLFFGTFNEGSRAKFFDADLVDLASTTGVPFWLITLLIFFAVAIPFFTLFYLGLKILVTNLKSLNGIAKYSLLGLWLISVISLAVIGIKQGLSYHEEAKVIQTEALPSITKKDTLVLRMSQNEYYDRGFRRDYDFEKTYDTNDNRIQISQGIRLIVKSTSDSIAKIKVEKIARGEDYSKAKKRAEAINYNYQLVNKQLLLDNFLTIGIDEKIRSQEIQITVYLPVGSVLYADKNTYYYHRNDTNRYQDILNNGKEEHYLQILNRDTKCLDCSDDDDDDDDDDDFQINIDANDEKKNIIINKKGIEINSNNSKLKIDENGIKGNSEEVKVNIDEDGVKIISKED